MDISNLIIGTVLTTIGGISAIQTLKLIFTPINKISLADGNSTILGRVVDKEKSFSPITKTPCVYCVYKTFERGARFGGIGNKPKGIAQVVAGTGVKHFDFFLENDSGKIYVKNKAQLYGNSKNPITVYDDTKEYEDAIKEFKVNTQIGEGEGRQYEEDVIMAGDTIYIHGVVKVENNEKVMYPDMFSFKSINKVGSSPVGIIFTIVILVLGVNLLLHSF